MNRYLKVLFMMMISCMFFLNSLIYSNELKKNAFIYFDRSNGKEVIHLIYNEHYYIAPFPEHSDQCPCLNE